MWHACVRTRECLGDFRSIWTHDAISDSFSGPRISHLVKKLLTGCGEKGKRKAIGKKEDRVRSNPNGPPQALKSPNVVKGK